MNDRERDIMLTNIFDSVQRIEKDVKTIKTNLGITLQRTLTVFFAYSITDTSRSG